MLGTIAITDKDWYRRLRIEPDLDEVNFWSPSAARAFRAPEFSPFLFKLRAPDSAICGFGYFARYARLPDWLAWETFGTANGCASLLDMRSRIGAIRERIRFRGTEASDIGCILIVRPTFFPEHRWVPQPRDWPVRTQAHMKYDLTSGEGARVWRECQDVAHDVMRRRQLEVDTPNVAEGGEYGAPVLVAPRLGQGTFRIAVTEAYERGCALTGEHSLPALEAAHIRPFGQDGPHIVPNGLLLRADLHRLFDKGYLTVTPDLRAQVSRRLRSEFENGHTYYPLAGQVIRVPKDTRLRPQTDFLKWHNDSVYLG